MFNDIYNAGFVFGFGKLVNGDFIMEARFSRNLGHSDDFLKESTIAWARSVGLEQVMI